VRLPIVAAALLTGILAAAACVPQGWTSAAIALPKGGEVEVTGWSHVGLDGNSGPVTVLAHGITAKNLRAALESSSTFKTTAACMEDLEPFVIRITSSHDTRPTLVAQAFGCGGPGVKILVNGTLVTDITDDCAVQASVAAVLPDNRALGTRQVLSATCATISPLCLRGHASQQVPTTNQTPPICLVGGARLSQPNGRPAVPSVPPARAMEQQNVYEREVDTLSDIAMARAHRTNVSSPIRKIGSARATCPVRLNSTRS
jgi:hypothetical protein